MLDTLQLNNLMSIKKLTVKSFAFVDLQNILKNKIKINTYFLIQQTNMKKFSLELNQKS